MGRRVDRFPRSMAASTLRYCVAGSSPGWAPATAASRVGPCVGAGVAHTVRAPTSTSAHAAHSARTAARSPWSSTPPWRLHGGDDGVADRSGKELLATLDEARQRIRQAGERDERHRRRSAPRRGGRRCPRGSIAAAARRWRRRDGGSRPPTGNRRPPASMAGAASRSSGSRPPAASARYPAGAAGGPTDIGPVSLHEPRLATSASPPGLRRSPAALPGARRRPAGRWRSRSPPRPHFDGSSTVSASAAATAASKALPPSRSAAAPAWAARGAAAHTTPFAPRRCTARRSRCRRSRSGDRRVCARGQARSGCARPSHGAVGGLPARARRWPGRAGRKRPPSASSVPTESHGDDGNRLAAVGGGDDDELVDTEREPLDRRPDVAPLLVPRSRRGRGRLGVCPEGDDIGGEATACGRHVDGGDLGAPGRDPLAHGRTRSTRTGGSCILDTESIQYTRTAVEGRAVARRPAKGRSPMTELLSKDEFRTALEDAIKGREAKNASFSLAWANGELQREHFARWAENHYHYVGPFADYLGYIYANTPDHATDAKDFLLQNMYEEELSDVRHTDLLIRFAEACGTTPRAGHRPAQHERRDAWPAGLVLRHGDARALRRRDRRARRRPRVAGADDLPQAVPAAAREVRLHRGGGRVLRPPHHLRRGARRARLPDRARLRRHARPAAALPRHRPRRRRDAVLLHQGAVRHVRRARDLGPRRTQQTTRRMPTC